MGRKQGWHTGLTVKLLEEDDPSSQG